MKRTFIPPSHRPFVRGSELNDNGNMISDILNNDDVRRQFIKDVISEKNNNLSISTQLLKTVFVEAFPNLKLNSIT